MKLKYLVTVAGLALTFSAQAADLKELRVGTDPTYEPFTYKTADGQLTGFDLDLARALCDQIKRKCVFVETSWDGIIPSLMAKKFDVIMSAMSITPDRQKQIDFSDRYAKTPSVLVMKSDFKFNDPASLKGKKIGVMKSTIQEKYSLGELAPAGAIISAYESSPQVYLDLQSGRIDGTVANIVEVTRGFLEKDGGKSFAKVGPDLVGDKYFGTGVGIGMRKGQDDLKAELDTALKTIRANGTFKKVNDKYFKFDVYGQ